MKFDIEKLKKFEIMINVKTEQEYNQFTKICEENDLKIDNNIKPWSNYTDDTCFYFSPTSHTINVIGKYSASILNRGLGIDKPIIEFSQLN